MYQFLNFVDRPSKTGLMIKNVRTAFSLTLPSHLLHVCCAFGAGRDGQNGLLCVFASEKTRSNWWKKAPHQPITKLHGKTRDLVAGGQEEVVEGPTVMVRELRDVCQNKK